MNAIVKNILLAVGKGAESTVSGMVPGSGLVIEGVTGLLDKTDSNNVDALVKLEDGVVQAIGSLDAQHVSNATLLVQGLNDLKSAFSKIRSALKK